jgi:hypothetical protein
MRSMQHANSAGRRSAGARIETRCLALTEKTAPSQIIPPGTEPNGTGEAAATPK